MAISITKADVKRKLMIATTETSYDSAIDSLIAELQAALEYGIQPAYLADTTNAGLQATLKLGMLEVICGEFLEQLRRELGSSEDFSIAGLKVGARQEHGTALLQQGYDRLTPYLKANNAASDEAAIQSTTMDKQLVLPNFGVW